MGPTDHELLTFTDTSGLEYSDKLHEGDPDEARQLLAEHGEMFRQHLIVALLLERQADYIEGKSADRAYGKIENRGYKCALRHAAADLRLGEFLPGRRGNRYDEHFSE